MKNFLLGTLIGLLTAICGSAIFALLVAHEVKKPEENRKRYYKQYI